MKTERLISRVRAMLERATTLEELARLTNLLVLLQKEHIEKLEKKLAPTNNRRAS
jgi:hypothetical protein